LNLVKHSDWYFIRPVRIDKPGFELIIIRVDSVAQFGSQLHCSLLDKSRCQDPNYGISACINNLQDIKISLKK